MNFPLASFRISGFPRLVGAALVAVTLVLAGCNKAPDTAATATAGKSAGTPVTVEAVAAGAKGFMVGSQMSARTVYVFFDTQCPHCGALWEAAKPLKSQAKFIWIPVGILNAASTSQGATLLAAADPGASMEQHEVSMAARTGGISAGANIDAQKDQVAKNTALLTSFGFASIPTIIGTNAKTGAMVTQEGQMPTAALAALLGLQAPAPATN